MSPNLAYYRKQAKALVKSRRAADPGFKLATAQRVIAQEQGFTNWARFKAHLESDSMAAFKAVVESGNPDSLRDVLKSNSGIRIDAPIFGDAPAIVHVRENRAMVDVLLEFGANIDARNQFWGRTIGVLDDNTPEMVEYLLSRGAHSGITEFVEAVKSGDARKVRQLLENRAGLASHVNDPLFHFGGKAIIWAADHSRDMVDVLLEYGADLNTRSEWEPGPFGVLDHCSPLMAEYLISRGAYLDICAAARLGKMERVRELVAADPKLVHAKGGDGMRPLHFASTIEIVDFLLDHGAEIDARCVDHGSTATQYAVKNPEKCRHLINRGAKVDLFMAVALGDLEMVNQELNRDPESIGARIGQGKFASAQSTAPHIYNWELGMGLTPHQVAAKFAHPEILELLMERSPMKERFLAACSVADEKIVDEILALEPNIARNLTPEDMRLISDAAFANNIQAVRIMIRAGFDIDVKGAEGSTPIDRAAIHGFLPIVNLLLEHGASLEVKNNYDATPLGTCIWGSVNFGNPRGDYAQVAESLIQAGARVPETVWGGTAAVKAVLIRHGAKEETDE